MSHLTGALLCFLFFARWYLSYILDTFQGVVVVEIAW